MLGHGLAITAFVIWGLAPLYFHNAEIDNIYHMMGYRIVWSTVIVLIFMQVIGFSVKQWKQYKTKDLVYTTIAGWILNVSWYGFIYALTNNLVLSSSLAYFISPLMVIAASALIFGEHLIRAHKYSIVLMCLSMLWLLLMSGEQLRLPMMISVSFALYYVFKKKSRIRGKDSIVIEHLTQLPIVPLLFIFWPDWTASSILEEQVTGLSVALLQVAPVLLLSYAISKVPLQQIGIIQYIEPSLHFFIGFLIFSEPLDLNMLVALFLIWIAITVWVIPEMKRNQVTT